MKELSISPTHSLEQKNSAKRWIVIFLSIIFSQIFLLSFISYKKKSQLKELLNEISTLESFIKMQQPILEKKSKLKQDYEYLMNKKTYLTGNTQVPKVLLKKISKTIPVECCLTHLIFKNNLISIKGISKTWLSLYHFFDALSTVNKLGTLRLKNSAKEAQYLNFEIEFTLAKNKGLLKNLP